MNQGDISFGGFLLDVGHRQLRCGEAMQRFKVSKSAFDVAWIRAIEKTGNRHWYDPLPRSRRKTTRMLLA
jgi:hypothetical protein